jgi:hypothetical protein
VFRSWIDSVCAFQSELSYRTLVVSIEITDLSLASVFSLAENESLLPRIPQTHTHSHSKRRNLNRITCDTRNKLLNMASEDDYSYDYSEEEDDYEMSDDEPMDWNTDVANGSASDNPNAAPTLSSGT